MLSTNKSLTLKNYKKQNISKEDVNIYDSLLLQMIELKNAGLKTSSDVKTITNSKNIKALDIQINNIDIQLELLELYARTHDI
jgi:hypothetical protein